MRDKQSAIELMDIAWRKRRELIESPPQSQENRQALMHEIRNDLSEAVATFKKIDAGYELVTALRKLGHVEQDMVSEQNTLALHEEAVAVCRTLGDVLLLAHTVRHLGDIHRSLGSADVAMACYDEALELYRHHKQPPTLDFANAIRPMAILKEDTGNVEDAKTLWQEALALYADIGLKDGVDECSYHLSKLNKN